MQETISQAIIDIAEKYSHRTAYQMRERKKAYKKLLFKEFYLQAKQIASYLRKIDIASQEPVGIYAPNSPDWAVIFAATMLNNGVAVPIDCSSGPAELKHIIQDTGIKCVFTTNSHVSRLVPFNLQDIIMMDKIDHSNGKCSSRLHSIDEITGQPLDDWVLPPVNKKDVAVIIYTSGTTAAPKGVMLTHEGLLSNVHAIQHALGITENDCFLSVLGLSHTFELSCGLILPLCVGACVTYTKSLKYTTIFNDMALTRPTVLLAVPLLFKILLEHAIARTASLRGTEITDTDGNGPKNEDTAEHTRMIFGGALRFCICGGAPVATSLIEEYREIGILMLQAYGLTEVSGVATLTTGRAEDLETVGSPLPHVDIKLIAEKGAEKGEVCIRGPSLMTGYNNNSKATADCIKQGWFYTGDIGYLDENGNLNICGRTKNLIVTNAGVNVHPEELEQRIQKSELVAEVCVIGKQRPDGTETVEAVVVPDKRAYQEYLARQVAQNKSAHEMDWVIMMDITELTSDLASYKKIHKLHIQYEPLPRGRTRKILRQQVKQNLNVHCEQS